MLDVCVLVDGALWLLLSYEPLYGRMCVTMLSGIIFVFAVIYIFHVLLVAVKDYSPPIEKR